MDVSKWIKKEELITFDVKKCSPKCKFFDGDRCYLWQVNIKDRCRCFACLKSTGEEKQD